MIQSAEAMSDPESINCRMRGTAGYQKEKAHSAGARHVELLGLVLDGCQLAGASQAREADTAPLPEPAPQPVTERAQISLARDAPGGEEAAHHPRAFQIRDTIRLSRNLRYSRIVSSKAPKGSAFRGEDGLRSGLVGSVPEAAFAKRCSLVVAGGAPQKHDQVPSSFKSG